MPGVHNREVRNYIISITVRHKNFTVIKFYGLPLNHLDEC